MSKNATKSLYRHSVCCPACRRKLMIVRRDTSKQPVTEIHDEDHLGLYREETRCPSCRAFVGVME